MTIRTSEAEAGRVVNIEIAGRFDFQSASIFRDAYRDREQGVEYRIDLQKTEYMDSSALGMLLLLREHAGGDDAKIVLRGARPDVARILSTVGMDKLFEITD